MEKNIFYGHEFYGHKKIFSKKIEDLLVTINSCWSPSGMSGCLSYLEVKIRKGEHIQTYKLKVANNYAKVVKIKFVKKINLIVILYKCEMLSKDGLYFKKYVGKTRLNLIKEKEYITQEKTKVILSEKEAIEKIENIMEFDAHEVWDCEVFKIKENIAIVQRVEKFTPLLGLSFINAHYLIWKDRSQIHSCRLNDLYRDAPYKITEIIDFDEQERVVKIKTDIGEFFVLLDDYISN